MLVTALCSNENKKQKKKKTKRNFILSDYSEFFDTHPQLDYCSIRTIPTSLISTCSGHSLLTGTRIF